jgi:hypothetical protein
MGGIYLYSYDVVIVGGGVSGAVAGIASAREGAKTLIIEKMGFLGGSLTASGVGPMMTFHAGDLQVVRGIAEEIIENLKHMGGSPGHIVDTTGYTYTVTPFDAELLKHVLEKMYIDAKGELLYHGMLDGVEVDENNIKSISVATKSGKLNFEAKVFIDATGDGDLAAWSGVDFLLGREEDNLCQPVTMNLKIRNVDIEKLKECIRKDPDDFPNTSVDLLNKAPRLSMGGFEKLFTKGRENGEITFSREYILLFETNNQGEVIVNTTRMQKVNPTNAWELTAAEIECRRQALELFNFMKKRIPGFENCVLMYTGPNLGIRESRKIIGKYILKADDIFDNTIFEDEIACGGYPIDVHSPDGEGTNTKHLKWGAVYGIPYRCLINEKINNLINVGRCISTTQDAGAATRVSPIAMAVGQAGGTAAGICAKNNCNPAQIYYQELKCKLLKNGAYIR